MVGNLVLTTALPDKNMLFIFCSRANMTAMNNLVLETAATEFQRRFHISADQGDSHPQLISHQVRIFSVICECFDTYFFFL